MVHKIKVQISHVINIYLFPKNRGSYQRSGWMEISVGTRYLGTEREFCDQILTHAFQRVHAWTFFAFLDENWVVPLNEFFNKSAIYFSIEYV